MRIDVITIFPDYLRPLELSLPGKARASGLLDLRVHDLRDWTHDRHRTVDDTPYGGGAGMVMKPDPWGEALDAVSTGSTTGKGLDRLDHRLCRYFSATDTSATVPVAATTFWSVVSAFGANVLNVHSPGAAKNRNWPVADVGTSAVNSPDRSSRRT